MTNLKLAKLSDRTPARITVTVSADLYQALCDYQKLYATASWRRFGSRRTGSPGSSRPTRPSRSAGIHRQEPVSKPPAPGHACESRIEPKK